MRQLVRERLMDACGMLSVAIFQICEQLVVNHGFGKGSVVRVQLDTCSSIVGGVNAICRNCFQI